MPYQFPPDVDKLVRDIMASGSYSSQDDLLRDALHAFGEFVHSQEETEEEFRQTVVAVKEGALDAESGRMRPLRAIISEASGHPSTENK